MVKKVFSKKSCRQWFPNLAGYMAYVPDKSYADYGHSLRYGDFADSVFEIIHRHCNASVDIHHYAAFGRQMVRGTTHKVKVHAVWGRLGWACHRQNSVRVYRFRAVPAAQRMQQRRRNVPTWCFS